jgi:hypothetical protein
MEAAQGHLANIRRALSLSPAEPRRPTLSEIQVVQPHHLAMLVALGKANQVVTFIQTEGTDFRQNIGVLPVTSETLYHRYSNL